MNIEPLPKKFYERAVALGITEIHLAFQGGSDEGFCNISFTGGIDWQSTDTVARAAQNALDKDIDAWVWSAYSYNGAGDGNDYGDDITYNLGTMTATWSEWTMQRHDLDDDEQSFGFAEDDDDEAADDDESPVTSADAAWRAKIQELKDAVSTPIINTDRALAIIDELQEMVEGAS